MERHHHVCIMQICQNEPIAHTKSPPLNGDSGYLCVKSNASHSGSLPARLKSAKCESVFCEQVGACHFVVDFGVNGTGLHQGLDLARHQVRVFI